MLYYLGARPGLQVRLELRVAALARELHHDRLSVLTVNYARLGYFLSPQRVDLGSGPPCAAGWPGSQIHKLGPATFSATFVHGVTVLYRYEAALRAACRRHNPMTPERFAPLRGAITP